MTKGRMEAFSDGVIAIIITIMVLELKLPEHNGSATVLVSAAPSFAGYVLSFIYVAIYWNNHHHMLHTVHRVDGLILWANAHLLFWLSLVPATTAWLGNNFLAPVPTALYGVSLLMPAIAYFLLQRAIMHRQGTHSVLAVPTSVRDGGRNPTCISKRWRISTPLSATRLRVSSDNGTLSRTSPPAATT